MRQTLHQFIAGPDGFPARIWHFCQRPPVLGLIGSIICGVLVGEVVANHQLLALAKDARTTASLHAAVLQTSIERMQTLPFAVSQDEAVHAVLRHRDPRAAHALDLKLEALATEVGPSVVYVLDRDAYGVSTSNWRSGQAFCRDPAHYCAKRHYFLGAMADGKATLFALGRADQQPGLYLSRAVDEGHQRLGVAVSKVRFNDLEAHWREVGYPSFTSNADGVILLSSVRGWHLRTLAPLPKPVQASLLKSTQFGLKPLKPLIYQTLVDHRPAFRLIRTGTGEDGESGTFVEVEVPVKGTDWTLHTLRPVDRSLAIARAMAGGIAVLLGLVATLSFWIWSSARKRALLEVKRAAVARLELEQRVLDRTLELTSANERLLQEFSERQKAEGRVMALQEDLFQANKLAILGQIVAGVAHEINQPLASIRIQADNALEHLRRQGPDRAKLNLEILTQLIDRIASITGELLTFSRRNTDVGAPVRISEVVNGALLLVGHRVRETQVQICRIGTEELVLTVPRVKLEQVLVNLLRNALDAISDRQDGQIELSTARDGATIKLTITDNGPGISQVLSKSLFMPFQTTKASGLGLGLIISREIMRSLGGDLIHLKSATGAVFQISLPVSATGSADIS